MDRISQTDPTRTSAPESESASAALYGVASRARCFERAGALLERRRAAQQVDTGRAEADADAATALEKTVREQTDLAGIRQDPRRYRSLRTLCRFDQARDRVSSDPFQGARWGCWSDHPRTPGDRNL